MRRATLLGTSCLVFSLALALAGPPAVEALRSRLVPRWDRVGPEWPTVSWGRPDRSAHKPIPDTAPLPVEARRPRTARAGLGHRGAPRRAVTPDHNPPLRFDRHLPGLLHATGAAPAALDLADETLQEVEVTGMKVSLSGFLIDRRFRHGDR